MSVPASQKDERTKGQIPRDPIRCDDESAVLNGILDQDLMMNSTGPPCNLFGISDAGLSTDARSQRSEVPGRV